MKPKTKAMTWAVALAAVLSLAAPRLGAAATPDPTPTDLGVADYIDEQTAPARWVTSSPARR